MDNPQQQYVCATDANVAQAGFLETYDMNSSAVEFAQNADTMTTIVLMDRIKEGEPGVHVYGFGWITWEADVMTFVDKGY
jgi:hypothetical protein